MKVQQPCWSPMETEYVELNRVGEREDSNGGSCPFGGNLSSLFYRGGLDVTPTWRKYNSLTGIIGAEINAAL